MAEQKTMKITVVRYRPEQDDKPWEQTLMFLISTRPRS